MLDALANFGVRDLLDVVAVSFVLYAAFAWLQRSQAALVAVGLAIVAGLYTAAQLADLELITTLFRGAAAASAVVAVILFQDEIRQALEELAAWAMGRRDDYQPRLDSTDELVACLANLARDKIGALVVLAGIQKLDRHGAGGERLNGRLSGPLLESIFDPHSAGHDGAVIVEDRRVSRFGVQLPLSRNTDSLRGRGTRHSAALGLAERTDALCLVVSEERGTVSAAMNGTLRVVPSEAELAAVVRMFFKQRRALAAHRPWLPRLLRTRWREKLAACAAAIALWLVHAAGAAPTTRIVSVPVALAEVGAGLVVSRVDPPTVELEIAGSRRALFFSTNEVGIALDASELRAGSGRIDIAERDVRLPAGLALRAVEPRGVVVQVEERGGD